MKSTFKKCAFNVTGIVIAAARFVRDRENYRGAAAIA